MYGLPAYQITKLQRVQNSAARLIYLVPKVVPKIEFKMLILTFEAIYGLPPEYLYEQIRELPNYNLRMSNGILLAVPSHKSLNSIGD